jgi:hypothetical protein
VGGFAVGVLERDPEALGAATLGVAATEGGAATDDATDDAGADDAGVIRPAGEVSIVVAAALVGAPTAGEADGSNAARWWESQAPVRATTPTAVRAVSNPRRRLTMVFIITRTASAGGRIGLIRQRYR